MQVLHREHGQAQRSLAGVSSAEAREVMKEGGGIGIVFIDAIPQRMPAPLLQPGASQRGLAHTGKTAQPDDVAITLTVEHIEQTGARQRLEQARVRQLRREAFLGHDNARNETTAGHATAANERRRYPEWGVGGNIGKGR